MTLRDELMRLADTPEDMKEFEPIADAIRDYKKRWGWAKTAGYIGSVFTMLGFAEDGTISE
jgi:hypothetical protein